MAKKTTYISLLLIISTISWAFSAATASESTRSLDKVLGTIDWGDSHKEVVNKIKDSLLEKMRSQEQFQYDRIEMQEARQRVIDKVEQIESSYDVIEAKGGGYETSVISEELHRDGNDSLLTVKDPHAQRFFIFENDKLYKLVVAYSNDYLNNISFKRFLVQTGRKYGKPNKIDYTETVDGQRKLHKAVWSGDKTNLKVQNYADYFNTFIMVFSDKSHKEPKRKETSSDSKAKVSETIQNLTVGSSIKGDKPGKNTASKEDELMKQMFGDVNVELTRELEEPKKSKEKKESQKSKDEDSEHKTEKRATSEDSEPDPARKKQTEDDLVIY